ncbi:putative transmembrane sensor [Novosphingobium sp. Rr 2-17]|uniref:FecR family protein n=1 Tax=Novosphingobium sp. Rr 2-17 TaxID=555793 RepID=UPI0002698194|nr:FecR domain-containing protein [Novosphingobium sp. Rr 2-17]EIZ80482.1 putative transmembrane sensor [Novosphingobium sp. Rr 2-17]
MNPPTTTQADSDEAILDLAARWLARAQAGLNTQERAAFRHWLAARPEHAAAADLVARAWAAAPAAAAQGGFAPSSAEHHLTKPRAARPLPLRPLAWGGGIATAALAVLAVFWLGQPVAQQYATGAGERRMVTLADGSRMWLAPATRLTTRIGWFERSSTIETGEAVFDVAHERRGFTVSAGPVAVIDRGTLFAVRLRPKTPVRVTLARGAVTVEDRSSAALLASPVPGEAVEVVGSRAITRRVDAESAMSWREGRLTFANTPLDEAVTAFAEQGMAIRLADPGLGTLRISGAYTITDIEPFLSALSSIHPVRWSRVTGGYAIERR